MFSSPSFGRELAPGGEISLEVMGGEETGKERTGERVSRVPCLLCWLVREYVYVIVDDYSRAVFTRLLRLKRPGKRRQGKQRRCGPR